MNIHDIKTWPPGAIMCFDSRPVIAANKKLAHIKPHVGLGLVIANDKCGTIWVIWDSNCKDMFTEYPVKSLNPQIISRVG